MALEEVEDVDGELDIFGHVSWYTLPRVLHQGISIIVSSGGLLSHRYPLGVNNEGVLVEPRCRQVVELKLTEGVPVTSVIAEDDAGRVPSFVLGWDEKQVGPFHPATGDGVVLVLSLGGYGWERFAAS